MQTLHQYLVTHSGQPENAYGRFAGEILVSEGLTGFSPVDLAVDLLPELQGRGHDVAALSFGDSDAAGYPYPLTRIPRRNYLRRQIEYYQAAARLWAEHDVAYIHSLGLPLPPALRPRLAKIVGDHGGRVR